VSQFYGKAGKLETPVTIDSVAYGYFVSFNSAPDAATETLILSSRLTSWSRSGNNVLGVVERQRVVGSILNSENVEVEQFFYTGNTLGAGIEPQRFYAKQSPEQAIRGGKRAAVVGDTIRFTEETAFHQAAFPIVAVETYAVSAEPRWQQGEAPRARYVLKVHMNPTAIISTDATQRIRFAPGPATGDAGLRIFDLDTSDYEASTRVIFEDDASYYPPDATFPGAEARGEYWFDETLTAVTFASQNEDLPDMLGDTYRMVWYVEISEVQENADRIIVEAADGGAGYGALDEVSLLTRFVDGDDWTEYIDVYRLADGSWPEFSIEFRDALNSEAEAVGFDVEGGEIVAYRQKTAGVWTVTPITPLVLSGSDTLFRIIIDRTSATSINFVLVPETSSSEGIHEFTSLSIASSGWLSVAVYDGQAVPIEINVSPEADVTWFVQPLSGDVSAVLLERHESDITAVFEQTFEPQDAEPIDEVYNLTAGTAMTESSTPARDHYKIVSGDLVFYAESDRDEIRVTHEEGSAGDPDAVGIAPEQFFPSTVNLATTGNSTAGANRAYWQDRVTFADPEELFDAPQDAPFEVHREGGWDPAALPSLSYSYKGNSSASWTAVGTNALALPGPRVFLLRTSWVEGLSEPLGKLCWQMAGTRILAQGSINGERQINVLIRTLQAFDDCWLRVRTGGISLPAFSGLAQLSVGATEFECYDGTCWRATEAGWGVAPNGMPTPVQWPWYYPTSGRIEYRSQDFTPDSTVLECGSATRVAGDSIQDGLFQYGVGTNQPFASDRFGSTAFVASVQAGFQFGGLTIGIPIELRKFPVEVLEAYGKIQFAGLTRRRSYWSFDTGLQFPDDVDSGGAMRLALVGAKPRRRTVRQSDGSPTTVTEYTFKSYGVSVATTASEDATVFTATALLQELVDSARADNFPAIGLWPTVAEVPTSGFDGLAAYVKSLIPELNAEVAGYDEFDPCAAEIESSCRGTLFTFDQVSVGEMLMRVRVPVGMLDHRAFPKVRPALVPY
jgi:hypothetical protein